MHVVVSRLGSNKFREMYNICLVHGANIFRTIQYPLDKLNSRAANPIPRFFIELCMEAIRNWCHTWIQVFDYIPNFWFLGACCQLAIIIYSDNITGEKSLQMKFNCCTWAQILVHCSCTRRLSPYHTLLVTLHTWRLSSYLIFAAFQCGSNCSCSFIE